MIRSFLSRGSRTDRVDRAGVPSFAVPAIPPALQAKVNQRLEQLGVEQEHEKIATEDSDQSENSLIQEENVPLYASSSSTSDDDNDNTRTRKTITKNNSRPFVSNEVVADESARLLRSIASDLSESATAYFEEDASESSNPRENFFQSSTSSLNDPLPARMHVTMDYPQENGSENHSAARRWTVLPRIKADERTYTSRPTSSLDSMDPHLSLKIMIGAVVTTLILCFVWQLMLSPMNWMAWFSTGVSTYCATCLWPTKRSTVSNDTELRWRSQMLLAEGLPLKSRLLVAQTQARALEKRIKLLKELQKVNRAFLARTKEEALALTVQVLLKSNRSPASTHLNALTLSILPTKLATIDVKMQMPPVWALAQSKRGSHYILLNLFRELLSDKSSMFRYPKLKIKSRNRLSESSKKEQERSSEEARVPKQTKPQRLDEI